VQYKQQWLTNSFTNKTLSMKLLKSFDSIYVKRQRGMTQREEEGSYQLYTKIDKKPTGKPPETLTFQYEDGSSEKFYLWVFYEEIPDTADKKHDKQYKGHFKGELEQERYEWYGAGWVDFYDQMVAPSAVPPLPLKEHKLFFFWDRKDTDGVAIYINDERAVKFVDTQIKLAYTPATTVGDPPTIPPPPPPSSK